MPSASLFIIIPKERSWVRGVYAGSSEHIQQLKQQLEDAHQREMNINGMLHDLRRDSMDAYRDRVKLQRELWAQEYGR